MSTFEEIREQIDILPATCTPVSFTKHDFKRSDGLTETRRHDIYDEEVTGISKKIWSSQLSLTEKLNLAELLEGKLRK